MITTLKVLNTVTSNGTDVSVGADGILNIAGGAVADAYNVRNVTINTSVAEVAGVVLITPTSANSTAYNLYVSAFSKSTGIPKTLPVSFTSASSASRLTISNQIIAAVNADTDLSVVATLTGSGGSETVTLTSTTGYPMFIVGGTTASVNTQATASITTIATNIQATVSTAGVIGAGLGSLLQTKYAYAAAGNALIYNELANLTTTSFYTEIVIDYLGTGYSGSSAFRGEVSTNQAVVLVLYGTSAQGTNAATSSTVTNYNDLLGVYGTVVGLQAGYRVALAAITGTAGTNTSNVQTMTSGTLGTQDVVSGDYVVGDTGSAATNARKVIATLSETTFLTTTATAITGSSFRVARWRSLPL